MSESNALQNWEDFFSTLDRSLLEPTTLTCIGGCVVVNVYGFTRHTADVDVVEIAPLRERQLLLQLGGKGSELTRRTGVYLDFVGVTTLAEDYEARLVEVFPGRYKNLKLVAIDPYDLALAKLERDSPKDREDVLYLAAAIPFDLQTLRDRYQNELRWMLTGDPKWKDHTLELWIELIKAARGEKTPDNPD